MNRTVLHLSDLHFGSAHARARARTLLGVIDALRPDLVVVSGDLTQRARSTEFAEARDFLDAMRAPRVVVPGNHDVPLWNVARRLLSPLGKWHRHLGATTTTSFLDAGLAVVGIDSTRRLGLKGGIVASDDLWAVARTLHGAAEGACRIVVAHHPLEHATTAGAGGTAMGGRRALHGLARLGVELVLSGHLHESGTFRPVDRLSGLDGPILLVNAGTATSHRGRRSERDVNCFNLITVRPSEIGVATYVHSRSGVTYVAEDVEWFPRARQAARRARRSVAADGSPKAVRHFGGTAAT